MSAPRALGFDIGGTNLRAAAMVGREVCWRHCGPIMEGGWVEGLSAVPSASTLGVAVASFIDADGVPFDPLMRDVSHRIERRTGVRPVVLNDADAAALAEALIGAGRGCVASATLCLGTGLGLGVVHRDRLLTGAGGSGPEIGQLLLGAGHVGLKPLQHHLSGTALARHAGRSDGVVAAEAARNSDGRALEAFQRMAELLGVVAAGIAALFSPEVVVVGGGMVGSWDLLAEGSIRSFRDHLPRQFASVRLEPSRLGPEAGAIGAALAGAASDGPYRSVGWAAASHSSRSVG